MLRVTRVPAVFVLVLALVIVTTVRAQEHAILSPEARFHPVFGAHGMVATQEKRATRIGLEILRQGGNAIDAAVAIGFALAVALPRAGNLGGGGFMLIHHAETGETVALDYRETAPAAAGRDLFLNAEGEVDEEVARFSHRSAGVPGTVAGLAAALARYGSLPLAQVMEPAIRLAEDGFVVDKPLSESLRARAERLMRWPATRAIFFKSAAEGLFFEPGERLIQSDLAATLTMIAEQGPGAFYGGEIGRRIAAEMAANGGLITLDDLRAYRAVYREPVRGRYRDVEVAAMPPPSSGGVHLVQMLNILEGYPIDRLGHNSAQTIHLMAEAMRRAYADRSQYLGDPDFWPVPVKGLTSKAYAAELRALIDPIRATPSEAVAPGQPAPYESDETTHFSVIDAAGNVVSNTYTINFSYGSGIVAAGTGILLNNEMDDFSAKPGVPNAYGLIGGEANAIEGGKRPLSSMTPTILFRDGEPWVATGSPGGSRIISTTLQILLNVIDHGLNVAAATYAPRVHHQWLPDELRVERGLSPDTLARLAAMGHTVVEGDAMGSTQSVLRADEGFYGAADPRRTGALAVGY